MNEKKNEELILAENKIINLEKQIEEKDNKYNSIKGTLMCEASRVRDA